MPTGYEFMHKTRYHYLEVSDQRKGIPQPPLQLAYNETAFLIELPLPAQLPVKSTDVRRAIEERVSLRRYAKTPLTLAELSWLLWATQGVKRAESHVTWRTVPSAGARHAFETYLLVNRVEGLTPGLYRFLAMEHQLLQVSVEPVLVDELTEACFNQGQVQTSAVTFLWVAVVYRMAWRYGERGYRYLHLDAGHVCQNLYLAAECVDAGVCAIAAFSDESMNQLLQVDGEEEFVIYVATVGKKG